MRSLVAGFGAMIVMRSKLFNFKTQSGEEFAIGPDAVLSTFLSSVDRNIDRNRSRRRQRIVIDSSAQIADPISAPAFLRTSLASYQNLSAAEKKDVDDVIHGVIGNKDLAVKELTTRPYDTYGIDERLLPSPSRELGDRIMRWTKTKSRKRPNLNPTSRKCATRSNPRRSWKRRDAAFSASIAPSITCFPKAAARGVSACTKLEPAPRPRHDKST